MLPQLCFFLGIAFGFIAWGIVAFRYIWPELRFRPRADYLLLVSTAAPEPRSAPETRRGRRTARTLPLLPPPQKNWSPPSDSSPDTTISGGISSLSRTSPVRGSICLSSLSSPSQVACQSSPSTQVTPVTKRLDSMVRRTAPVWGST
jgi:hypothetical protein